MTGYRLAALAAYVLSAYVLIVTMVAPSVAHIVHVLHSVSS